MILDILEEQLQEKTGVCSVGKWISKLEPEEQDALQKIQQIQTYNLSELYRKLADRTELPYKLTSFKSHMRGVCTCQH